MTFQVELVSIGDEVLRGMTVNSNAAFLSRELERRGYEVVRHTVLPDNVETIRTGLKESMLRSSLVIATGGLGPTLDDVTRQAAQPLFSKKPLEIKNSLGTASGVFGDQLLLLPGVPREMEKMFLDDVLPLMLARHPLQSRSYFQSCTLSLLRETDVDPLLRSLQKKGVKIGIYPSYGSLQVTFQSNEPLEVLVRSLQERFFTFFVGEGTIEGAVHRELTARKKTLALAESCTGGAIAARLIAIPGASRFFLGSIVAYANEWKEHFLGVRHDTLSRLGPVSTSTVEEMIEGVFRETAADYAVAVSGMLGPEGTGDQKSAGTVFIAIAERGQKIDAGKIQVPLDRTCGLELCIQTALGALWRRIVHNTLTLS